MVYRASLLHRSVDLFEDFQGLKTFFTGEFLDRKPDMNKNVFSNFYIYKIKPDFLFEFAVIDNSDITFFDLKHFCGNGNAHRYVHSLV